MPPSCTAPADGQPLPHSAHCPWHTSLSQQAALAEQGISTPTEIQAAAVPALLRHRAADFVLASHTGSGKTLAYLLPVGERCLLLLLVSWLSSAARWCSDRSSSEACAPLLAVACSVAAFTPVCAGYAVQPLVLPLLMRDSAPLRCATRCSCQPLPCAAPPRRSATAQGGGAAAGRRARQAQAAAGAGAGAHP